MQSFYGGLGQVRHTSVAQSFDDDNGPRPCNGAATSVPKHLNSIGLQGMSFETWLLEIDPSGGLHPCLQVIEDSYDTVRQVVRTYSVSAGSASGQMVLDPLIFDDFGVERLDHQQLLRNWFLEKCGVGKEPQDSSGTPNGHPVVQSAASSTARAPQSPGKGSSPNTVGDLRTMGFKEWLLRIDRFGSLLPYCEALQENYDTVAQIVKTYTLPTKGGPMFDVQFFEDAAVVNQSDQMAFLEWFSQECGVDISFAKSHLPTNSKNGLDGDQHLQPVVHVADQDGGATELRPAAGVRALTSMENLSTAAEAPADVDAWLSIHRLQEYAVNLAEAGYDELEVFRLVRPNEVEEMLDVVQVMKPGHRVKFRRAIEALQSVPDPQRSTQPS